MKLFWIIFLLWSLLSFSQKEQARYADTVIIKSHLVSITKTDEARDYVHFETLNKVAAYIHTNFEKFCDTVFYQEYDLPKDLIDIENTRYKNVVARIGPSDKPKIVVGAHYDVCDEQEGADDNASGVVGLLELARLLQNTELNYQIEFVAYSLEEPPFFRSEYMGSYVHAKSLYDNKDEVIGMVCLEMIGYFRDEKKSQQYPLGILKMFYGGKGDYITVVKKFSNGKFSRKFKRKMKRQNCVKTKAFTGPEHLTGIDFSDHLNYWRFDYSAVMISNTGFYRNPNYHKVSDVMETLDLDRMALVIDELYLSLRDWEIKD